MARHTARTGNAKLGIGYLRVSTEDQNLGPEAQRAALEAWAARNGARIVAWFEDHGVSGAAAVEKRPGLLAALDALAEHGAGLLAVAKRDRLARDVVACAMIERLAQRNGARVVSAAGEGTDGSAASDDPNAALMRGIIDLFAQYERQVIRARTRNALAVKRSRGERVGSVPFGYALAPDRRTLAEVPAEQDVIRAARSLRADGLTLRAIAIELEARGMRARNGARFAPSQIARMVAA
jgi:DNA invertase Pin-like site-specific DNA recombinase